MKIYNFNILFSYENIFFFTYVYISVIKNCRISPYIKYKIKTEEKAFIMQQFYFQNNFVNGKFSNQH